VREAAVLEEDLTPREKLRLYCYRKRWKDAGALSVAFGVHVDVAKRWLEEDCDDIPEIYLEGIDPGEHYRVLRFRSGLTTGEVADRIGVTWAHVYSMESGRESPKTLMEFWDGPA
jgi:hypothetical protein